MIDVKSMIEEIIHKSQITKVEINMLHDKARSIELILVNLDIGKRLNDRL